MPGLRQFPRLAVDRDGSEVEFGRGAACQKHFAEMAGEAEAAHIRHRGGAVRGQNLRRCAPRLAHAGDRLRNRGGRGVAAHMGGEQDAGSDRLGEDERIAGAQPALAQDAAGGDLAVDREAERGFGTFGRMPAGQRDPLAVEAGARAGEHLKQRLLGLGRRSGRHHRDGERVERRAAHGENVVERVVRCDLAEHIGVVDDAAEQVDRGDDVSTAGRRRPDGGIVRRREADRHAATGRFRRQPRQGPPQRAGPDLGGAAPAAHFILA